MSQRFMGSQTPSGWKLPPSGGYTTGLGNQTSGGIDSAGLAANTLYAQAVFSNQPFAIDQLEVRTVTGKVGNHMVMGIYDAVIGTVASNPAWYPGNLLGETAEFTPDTANTSYVQSVNITIPEGLSFFVFHNELAGGLITRPNSTSGHTAFHSVREGGIAWGIMGVLKGGVTYTSPQTLPATFPSGAADQIQITQIVMLVMRVA